MGKLEEIKKRRAEKMIRDERVDWLISEVERLQGNLNECAKQKMTINSELGTCRDEKRAIAMECISRNIKAVDLEARVKELGEKAENLENAAMEAGERG